MSAIPAAAAMIGMLMHAPSRCTLGKIGSSPTKVIVPPVFSGDSPSSCITARNSALMSKPAETLGVSNAVLVMMVLLCGKRTAKRVTALVMSIFFEIIPLWHWARRAETHHRASARRRESASGAGRQRLLDTALPLLDGATRAQRRHNFCAPHDDE